MVQIRKRMLGQLLVMALVAGGVISVVQLSAALVVRSDGSSHTARSRVQYYDLQARELANRNRYQAVGQLVAYMFGEPVGVCTGTVIDVPGHDAIFVLTAGHCVDAAQALGFRLGAGGNDFMLAPNVDDLFGSFDVRADFSEPIMAEAWLAHPGWDGNLFGGDDIALVMLESPAPVEPATIRRPRWDVIGTNTVSVGYGRTGDGEHGSPYRVDLDGMLTGAYWFDGRKRAGQNTILETSMFHSERKLLIKRFDRHISDPNYVNPDDPRGERYDFDLDLPRPLEMGLAQGDSGGPVFHESRHELIGVHSFGLNPYGGRSGEPIAFSEYLTFSGSVWLAPHYEWIFEAAEELLVMDFEPPEFDPDDDGDGAPAMHQAVNGQLGLPGHPISDQLYLNQWHERTGIPHSRVSALFFHRDYGDWANAVVLGPNGQPVNAAGDAQGNRPGGGALRRGLGGPRAGGGGGAGQRAVNTPDAGAPEPGPSQGQDFLRNFDPNSLAEEAEEEAADDEALQEFLRLEEFWRYKYRMAETEEERRQIRLEWRRLAAEKDPRFRTDSGESESESDREAESDSD